MANLNFNEVLIGGRLTAKPELKQTPNGIYVASFSIAVNRRVKQDGEQQADFFNVTAWRQTAELAAKYFDKGSSMFIRGTLRNRTWTDQNGQKRYATDIIADEISFVDSKSDGNASNSPQVANEQPPMDVLPAGEDLPF